MLYAVLNETIASTKIFVLEKWLLIKSNVCNHIDNFFLSVQINLKSVRWLISFTFPFSRQITVSPHKCRSRSLCCSAHFRCSVFVDRCRSNFAKATQARCIHLKTLCKSLHANVARPMPLLGHCTSLPRVVSKLQYRSKASVSCVRLFHRYYSHANSFPLRISLANTIWYIPTKYRREGSLSKKFCTKYTPL